MKIVDCVVLTLFTIALFILCFFQQCGLDICFLVLGFLAAFASLVVMIIQNRNKDENLLSTKNK
ncbi:MAG: hypothetical protein MR016_08435 [Agathobacter sp.]|nr:hypothetical protein [Agathobacter sp.]